MMIRWKQIPIVWRWRLLWAGVFVLLYTAFKLNISKTIASYRHCADLEHEYTTIPKEFNYSNDTTHVATGFHKDGIDVLKYVAGYCDTVDVDIKEILTYMETNDSIIIETNKITVEGGYANTLGLLDLIEQKSQMASISSAEWHFKKDINSPSYSLYSTFFTKRITDEK